MQYTEIQRWYMFTDCTVNIRRKINGVSLSVSDPGADPEILIGWGSNRGAE